MTLKRYTADSFLEAFLQAQEELGEDMIVVTSGTVQQNRFGGIYRTTVWELTAMPGKAKGTTKPTGSLNAPAKPVVSEEIFMPPAEPVKKAARSAATPAASAGSHSLHTSFTAMNNAPESNKTGTLHPGSHQSSLRGIHTIRSNQIGDHEPQLQRQDSDQENAAKLQAMLGEILKNRRDPAPARPTEPAMPKRTAPTPTTPTPLTAPSPGIRPPQVAAYQNVQAASSLATVSEREEAMTIPDLENKINDIFLMLRQIKSSSDKVLGTPSCSLPDGLKALRDRLSQQEAPDDFIDEVVEQMRERLPLQAQRNPALVWDQSCNWLQQQLQFKTPVINKSSGGPTVIVLMGPTGVGKTTTIAKLAASFALDVQQRKKVALFTIDTYRIGAPAQLSQYAQIIEADMEILLMPDEVAPALAKHSDKDIILVDTAGRSQKNHRELQDMKQFLDCFPAAVKFLVLSATTKFSDMVENERRFGELGYDHFIFTKTDETNSFGGLLALMYRSQSPLAYLTHGQSVPDDFRKAGFEFFLSQMQTDSPLHQNL